MPFPIPSSRSCGAAEEAGARPVSRSGACMPPRVPHSPRHSFLPLTPPSPPSVHSTSQHAHWGRKARRERPAVPATDRTAQPSRGTTGGQRLQRSDRVLRPWGGWSPSGSYSGGGRPRCPQPRLPLRAPTVQKPLAEAAAPGPEPCRRRRAHSALLPPAAQARPGPGAAAAPAPPPPLQRPPPPAPPVAAAECPSRRLWRAAGRVASAPAI